MDNYWQPVFGYEDRYLISDTGEVWSFRTSKRTFAKLLKPKITKKGYAEIGLSDRHGQKYLKIHRLVLFSFGVIPNRLGMQVNHIDGNKLNNDISNLEWCTPKENIQHAVKSGLSPGVRGEQAGNAKLTEQDVCEIRRQYQSGKFQKDIGAEFDIKQDHVSRIVNRKVWKHI